MWLCARTVIPPLVLLLHGCRRRDHPVDVGTDVLSAEECRRQCSRCLAVFSVWAAAIDSLQSLPSCQAEIRPPFPWAATERESLDVLACSAVWS